MTSRGGTAPVVAAVVVGLAGLARGLGPPEPTPGPALACPSGTEPYAGACRPTCASHAACRGGDRCAAVEDGRALCVPLLGCEARSDDTRCDDDVYALLSGGCVGDGAPTLAAATSEPACAGTLGVRRCHKTASGCVLVDATTPLRPRLR